MATKKRSFKEEIPLDQKISIAEAIGKLTAFHDVTAERIKTVFPILKTEEGSVAFKESVNNSSPCIRMEVHKPDGSYIGSCRMDIGTGNPQASSS
jgi:hypothetical protein